MNFYKLVCEYNPPGNYAGRFPENVPKPIKKAGIEDVEDVEEENEQMQEVEGENEFEGAPTEHTVVIMGAEL
jgi:hypothetical protein